MEASTKNIQTDIQESPQRHGDDKPRARTSSLAKVRSSMIFAQDAFNEQTLKIARHRRLFQVLYTVVVVIIIGVVWISLIGPLIIGLLSRPSLANLTRPHVAILKTVLNNSEFLPSKCLSNDTNNIVSNNSIDCPIGYVFNCTMCVPICGLWHPFGESYFIGYRVTTIITAVVDFLFSLTGLIILLKVPGTFRFPQINYLFMFINAVIFSSVLTAAALPGPYYFFCSERKEDYAVVAETPAVHITILGIVAHLSYFSFNLWFLCATVNVFVIVYFPSWQILESRKRKIIIFVIESVVSFGMPFLFPVAYLALYKKYSFVRLPQVPFIIEPLPGLVFIILPLLVCTAASLTIISLTVYKLQLQKLIVLAGRQKIQLRSYEIRLIIFAISLGIVVFVVFLEVSFDTRYRIILQFFLEEFWSCLTLQNNLNLFNVSNLSCSPDYQSYSFPIFTYIGDAGLGIWSLLLLVILTTKETREAWSFLFRKFCMNPIKSLVTSKFNVASIYSRNENVNTN